MLHYVLFGGSNVRVGVAIEVVPHGTNPVEMFHVSPIAPPRPVPVECLPLFAPKLKQEHMPPGVELERLKALACELLRHGWHEAETAGVDGPGVSVPIGRLTGEAFNGLSEILDICERQPEDAVIHLTASGNGLCFRPRRVRAMLSRFRTEGQLAFGSRNRKDAVA